MHIYNHIYIYIYVIAGSWQSKVPEPDMIDSTTRASPSVKVSDVVTIPVNSPPVANAIAHRNAAQTLRHNLLYCRVSLESCGDV